jgi:hypothetical protein
LNDESKDDSAKGDLLSKSMESIWEVDIAGTRARTRKEKEKKGKTGQRSARE